MTTDMKPAELVTEFIKLRDAKKQFEELCAAKASELYTERMNDIEAQLLDMLNSLGVESHRRQERHCLQEGIGVGHHGRRP